ncbi:MAG: hypothetical protein P9L94_15015 [Candidatus Hinthialibacter antarcticus]|nr:hypothetical protein [Candidatus Hinthialibacter antarcticus]
MQANGESMPLPTVESPSIKPHVNQDETSRKLSVWEVIALTLAFVLIVFGAIPNFFGALSDLRGEECSRRLTLAGNCLQNLANKNDTKPGEQICQLFDLNQLLENTQRGGSLISSSGRYIVFYKIGVEPDCADVGNHQVTLTLGADGKIVPPVCSLAQGEDGEKYRSKGLHVCDIEHVTGDLGLTPSN